MKIIYTENPLTSRTLLNEQEKENFKLKMQVDDLKEIIYDVYFRFKDDRKKILGIPTKKFSLYDPEGGLETLERWINQEDKEEDDEHFTKRYEFYLSELEDGVHVGDCTCVPCSCSKCHAESLLGIDTIKGLGKHLGHKVDSAFRKVTTCAEAIERLKKPYSLENDGSEGDKSWWCQEYVDRWNQEREATITWLVQYKQNFLDQEKSNE
jgi:hypothetical protein